MAVDFLQVREQIKALGEKAPLRAKDLAKKREQANDLLNSEGIVLSALIDKVKRIVQHHDPNLRCGLPTTISAGELAPLNSRHPLPELPPTATIFAADGSQITPDRHAAVNYCLINVGIIQVELDRPAPPQTSVYSHLFYDEALYTETGTITEASLALMRDLNERKQLAELAKTIQQPGRPVVTFTDGPMELWGGRDAQTDNEYQKSLKEYLKVLKQLSELQVITAGYVDKPAANLIVRLLEVASIEESQLKDIRKRHPFRGITDIDLYRDILGPGERSEVFEIQARSANSYRDELSLHFFYLNVGGEAKPWLARVEIPAWVAADPEMLQDLHAILIHQCRIMGARPYPYLLHRAHEVAVVSLQEKEQISNMIALELRSRGVGTGELSHKQSAKNQAGRTSFER